MTATTHRSTLEFGLACDYLSVKLTALKHLIKVRKLKFFFLEVFMQSIDRLHVYLLSQCCAFAVFKMLFAAPISNILSYFQNSRKPKRKARNLI